MRDDDYNALFVGVLGVELTEEVELALAQKASMDTVMEEQATRLPAHFLMTSQIFSPFL